MGRITALLCVNIVKSVEVFADNKTSVKTIEVSEPINIEVDSNCSVDNVDSNSIYCTRVVN